MSRVFDLQSGRLAVGDPTMGLARYSLSVSPGPYQLGNRAFRRVEDVRAIATEALINLDSPCVFALDDSHVASFEEWYHRVGNECAYLVLTIAERLSEFESVVGSRVGFYWEHEVAGKNREGQYTLDIAQVEKAVKGT
jgi:hypothetical protein